MSEMPNALTPENIAAIAENADKILTAVLGQGQNQRVPTCGSNNSVCCCPKKVKFFIFGNVWINNYNSVCPNLVG